ncbi:MAG: hypothetical protein ACT4PE_10565 [Candidatus Eiseniibacteriota bacterium]
MSPRRVLAGVAAASLVAGCGDAGDAGNAGGTRRAGVSTTAAVEHVPRTFYPRPESEDFWETIPRAEAGAHFILHVATRIQTPAEGPWTITFLDPAGSEQFRQDGLRVDSVTGMFTFLCETSRFAPGDWTIRLEVAEGGLVAGPRERGLRFRVE